jgi:hypothetical protein
MDTSKTDTDTPVLLPRHQSRPSRGRTCQRNRQPAQDLAQPELIKASRKSRGHYGPTPACRRSPTRGSLHVGLVVFVVGAGFLLPGTGYATFMMPAAGILISQGHDQEVLLLFDQVFAEPGWIPVFLGGITYHIGLLVMSVAVWRSGTLSKWTAALLAAAALVGLATFMDVVALARVGAVLWIAAFTALAVDVWRNSRMPWGGTAGEA